MAKKIVEIYGYSTNRSDVDFASILHEQRCQYIGRKCLKNRKSEPEKTIGTCTVNHSGNPVIICPFRLLEGSQIFTDCLHLLTMHQPGNQLHVVSEVTIPGGSVDYFLVSALKKKVMDFVGVELQTLDSTGTIWPARQKFAYDNGQPGLVRDDLPEPKAFGMNWKMTAKTILVQLHHKIVTFEHLNKHLVLVVQDALLDYMQREFNFGDIQDQARLGDPMHFHSYRLEPEEEDYTLELDRRMSTDTDGIASCLGLQKSGKVELAQIVELLESKISKDTLVQL